MNLLSEARNPIRFSCLISNDITNRSVIITEEKEKNMEVLEHKERKGVSESERKIANDRKEN